MKIYLDLRRPQSTTPEITTTWTKRRMREQKKKKEKRIAYKTFNLLLPQSHSAYNGNESYCPKIERNNNVDEAEKCRTEVKWNWYLVKWAKSPCFTWMPYEQTSGRRHNTPKTNISTCSHLSSIVVKVKSINSSPAKRRKLSVSWVAQRICSKFMCIL